MNVLKIIGDGLQDIFPGMPEIALQHETQLDEIPDWDSMAAVNFPDVPAGPFRHCHPE